MLGIGMARAALARLRPPWPECVGWVWWATYYVNPTLKARAPGRSAKNDCASSGTKRP